MILFLRFISHFSLLMISCFAFAALAAWRGIRDSVLLGLLGLVGIALPGYVAFFLWFLSRPLGHAFSFVLPLAEIAWLVWVWRRIEADAKAALKQLLVPAGFVFSASLLVLSAGFLCGGIEKPLETPWTRFSHRLPPDNMIPFVFAEEVRSRWIVKPMLADWHSSDRPPLQSGIVLSQFPFLPQPRELGYMALAVTLQSLWIYAMWLLLVAFGVSPRAIVLILTVTLFSGFTFLNTFFVWPKLLAAALMIGFSTLVLVDRYYVRLREDVMLMIVAGALLSLSMLAHGGTAFAFIGLIITGALLHRRLPLKSAGVIFGTAAVIYLPWTLYQKLFDPPGDLLLKFHLAGVEHPNGIGLWETVLGAYRKLTLQQYISGRWLNFVFVCDHMSDYWRSVWHLVSSALTGRWDLAGSAAKDVRILTFFYFAPNMGFLVTGVLAVLAAIGKRYRTPDWRTAARLWVYVVSTLLPWCVIMFRPLSTSIHQGTYVAVLLAFAAAILTLWTISPWLVFAIAALEILLNLLAYGVFTTAGGQLQFGQLVFLLLGLTFVGLQLRRIWRCSTVG